VERRIALTTTDFTLTLQQQNADLSYSTVHDDAATYLNMPLPVRHACADRRADGDSLGVQAVDVDPLGTKHDSTWY